MPKSNVTVIYDAIVYKLDIAFEDDSILDTALQEGIDLPHSCKSGVCGTCRAKLLEGRVEMDVEHGLEPEEIEQGYILTCQSHPLTPTVVVGFDV